MTPIQTRPAMGRGLPAVWLLAMAATALTAEAQSRPDPLDSRASVPAVIYQSSLKPGPGTAGSKPVSWREANDVVGRIGGWRVYARDEQQADTVGTPMPKDTGKVAPTGHVGHQRP